MTSAGGISLGGDETVPEDFRKLLGKNRDAGGLESMESETWGQ